MRKIGKVLLWILGILVFVQIITFVVVYVSIRIRPNTVLTLKSVSGHHTASLDRSGREPSQINYDDRLEPLPATREDQTLAARILRLLIGRETSP